MDPLIGRALNALRSTTHQKNCLSAQTVVPATLRPATRQRNHSSALAVVTATLRLATRQRNHLSAPAAAFLRPATL